MSGPVSKKVNSFITPVWMMAFFAAIRIFLLITSTMAIREMEIRHGPMLYQGVIISGVLVAVVLAAEATLYWVIRNNMYNRGWVLIHLIATTIAIIILPLCFIFFTWLLNNGIAVQDTGHARSAANQFRFYSFWLFFIVGSIFFTANLIKSLQDRNRSMEEVIDSIGTG